MKIRMMQAVAAGVLAAGMLPVVAQEPAPAQSQPVRDAGAVSLGGAPTGAAHSWTREQLVTSTVHEAWLLSGRNEDQFFDMVKELAAMSAEKRGLTLPETPEAGAKAGAMIKRKARKDPDQLLYAVVDRAVVKTGVKAAAGTGAK